MSYKFVKPPRQPLQHTSPTTHLNDSNYHLGRSYSPSAPKQNETSPSSQVHPSTNTSKIRSKKLAFLLNPSPDHVPKAEEAPISHQSLLHAPSKSSVEVTRKFIQLKNSASSSNPADFQFYKPKEFTRLTVSHLKPRGDVGKDHFRTSNNASTAVKKPNSLYITPEFTDEGREDATQSFSHAPNSNQEGSRLTRPSTGKSAKLRWMNMIYNETSPAGVSRKTRPKMLTRDHDSSYQLFSPNNSFSWIMTPGIPPNVTVNLTSNKSKSRGNTPQNSNYLQSGSNKIREGKAHSPKIHMVSSSHNVEKASTKPLLFNKMSSGYNNRPTSSSLVKFSSPKGSMDDIKGYNHPTNVQSKKVIMPYEVASSFENLEEKETLGSRIKKEYISNPGSPINSGGKTKQQEGNLKSKVFSSPGSMIQSDNFDTLLKEKKNIEGELYAVKEENERLRTMMKDLCREKILKRGNEAKVASVEIIHKTEEKRHNQRKDDLEYIVLNQQKIIDNMKQREGIVAKVLTLLQKKGVDIDNLDSVDSVGNNEDRKFEEKGAKSITNNISVERKRIPKGVHRRSKTNQEEYRWDLMSNERWEDIRAQSLIKEEKGEDESEKYDKCGSLGKVESEVEDGSDRGKIVKRPSSEAKSTAESMAFSTRKQLNTGKRSLSQKLKAKLQLDFTGLASGSSSPRVPKLNIVSSQSSAEKFAFNTPLESGQPLGFHDEFMARFEEFSESWRQEALNQRKY